MAKFNGNDLVLAINSTEGSELAFAHSQSASISFSNALIDVTSKDSNSWEEMISGRKSFSISTDGLADFVNSETTATTSESFSDYALSRNTNILYIHRKLELLQVILKDILVVDLLNHLRFQVQVMM